MKSRLPQCLSSLHKLPTIIAHPLPFHCFHLLHSFFTTDSHLPRGPSHQRFRRSLPRLKPHPYSSRNFLHDVDCLHQVLSAASRWSYEVEQSLHALPFQITVNHVQEVLKRECGPRVILCFFLWVRHLHAYKHTNLVYNTIIHLAAKAKEFKFVEEVSQYLKVDRCVLGTITCNVLIQAYGKAHKVEEAFSVFSRMDGCIFSRPNIWTCNLLLHILIKENELDWAYDFYHKVLASGFHPNTCTCNIWMLYLCKRNEPQEGRRWLDEMPCQPNHVTYSTLIDGFCKSGKMDEASSLFIRMLENDISPDVFVFSSLIHGYCKAEMLEEACKILKVMDSEGIKANVVTYTTLIDGMLKAGKTDAALGLLEYMDSTGCVPNEYLCTARIDSLCKNGQFDSALEFLKHMTEVGCAPNQVTYCALIDGYLKAGHEEAAMKLIEEMSANGCAPDSFLYSSLIYQFGKSGLDAKARMILEESLSKNSAPDTWIMNCWLSGLCRSSRMDHAYHLFINLKAEGFIPNTITYNILITGFCKSNRVGYARVIFEGITQHNCYPDLSSYTNLVKGYCKIGAVNHASKWLTESFEKGFIHVFRFHVYTILDMFVLRKIHHAKVFLKLLGSNCNFNAEVDRNLFFKLLEAEDISSACKAVATWKRLRTN